MNAPPFVFPESAVARMLAALVLNFQQVTKENGYSCTVGDVLTEIPDPGNLINYPAIALIRGQSVIENQNQSDQEWHKRIAFTAMVYLRTDDPTWDRLKVLADLETMLGNNWMLPDAEGSPTAREVTLDSDRPFGLVMNKPQVGFALLFSVRVSQSIFDASVTT